MARSYVRFVLLGALLLALFILGSDVVSSTLVRTILALPIVLVVPGLYLLTALPSLRNAQTAHKVLYTLALSVALTVVTGLVLDRTPWGLTRASWSTAIGLICMTAFGFGLRQPVVPVIRSTQQACLVRPSAVSMVGMAVATVILCAAVWTAARPAAPSVVDGYTVLWIVPEPGSTPLALNVGVQSMEFAIKEYRLELQIDGRATSSWNLTLNPGEQWEEGVSLQAEDTTRSSIAAVLYRLDAPDTVYRRVNLNREQ